VQKTLHKINTKSILIEVRHHMTHVILELYWLSKLVSKHMVCSMQSVYPSCSRLANRTKLSLKPLHLGVPLGASKMVSEPMMH